MALAVQGSQFEIAGAIDRPGHADLGADAGELAGVGRLNVRLSDAVPGTTDVIIDFSTPEATERIVEYARGRCLPVVVGTTGLTEGQVQMLRAAAEKTAIVYATNMSVGMNVLFRLVADAARLLGEEYDIEIVEAHHRFKKDSPSGSALTLSQKIAAATGRSWPGCLVHGRQGKETLRQAGTIGMHAIRAGDITGEHAVIYSTLGETVTLSHSAHNRDNFARGALRAALWLVGRRPGLYSMAQVLGME